MAKKKTKVDVKSKLNYKKPLKRCEPVIDDLKRIRKNEQSKIRYREKKFKSIPGGKRGKGRKKEADRLRKEIKALERGVADFSREIKSLDRSCVIVNNNRSAINSLKSKNRYIKKKLDTLYESRNFDVDKIKALDKEFHKNQKAINDLSAKNADILYGINKGAGFSPEEIATALKIPKYTLKKNRRDDFAEEFFGEEPEETEEEITEAGEPVGGGAAGPAAAEEVIEPDEQGYVEEMDEFFWVVAKDFDKNESSHLEDYDFVTLNWNGNHFRFSGKNQIMIQFKFKDMVRWCDQQSGRGTVDSAARITKYVTPDRKKLKYHAYLREK